MIVNLRNNNLQKIDTLSIHLNNLRKEMIGKISFIIFIHCIYSLLRYRKYLLASQEPLEHLPMDIVVEILFAVVLALISILSYTDKLKNLRQFAPVKTYDASFSSKNLCNFTSPRAEMFLSILKEKLNTEQFLLNEA